MIYADNHSIQALIMHRIGNKAMEEGCILSDRSIQPDAPLATLLTKYFFTPFVTSELYHFCHEVAIGLNELYSCATCIFDDPSAFQEQSVRIARHLYNESVHPKIKPGELYVAYFKDCLVEGRKTDAVGVFKSENKDTFLKVLQTAHGLDIAPESGINTNKLDKGCLIFNAEREQGYLVAIVDTTSKGADAKFWTESFLHVCPRKDSYSQTRQMLSLCKSFVAQLPAADGKLAKATYMNRSLEALKAGTVHIDSFAEQVFERPALVDDFKRYKADYQQKRSVDIDDSFPTTSAALKRRATGTMTTLRLDKHFDIHIHGGEQYIVRGYDEERQMYYYQLFFREER